MRWTTADVAAAAKGTVIGPDVSFERVSIDSRDIIGGELFVPLVGERDGHAFIDVAIERGAVGYVTMREPVVGATAVRVNDTYGALAALGERARDRLPDALIGVTGSVGKTSVKDLLVGALSTTFRTHGSIKNFNNEFGVPLTLVHAPEDTEVVVQEMGARGVGHIRSLCNIARPTGAIVTMVAAVHTSEFAGLDAVERGKGELVEAIPADGFVVLNNADPRVKRMATRTDGTVYTFGVSGDVVATAVELDDELRPRFKLSSPWGRTEIRLEARGIHQVANALAASAAAMAQGVPVEALADGLRSAQLSPWRMEFHRLSSGAVVINDAYNASPTSMEAALQSLAALDADRRIAVLGLMAEIGPDSDAEHDRISRLAWDLDIDVIAVDCDAYTVADHMHLDGAVDTLDDLRGGDAVLVKASRSAGLERVVERLLHADAAGPRA